MHGKPVKTEQSMYVTYRDKNKDSIMPVSLKFKFSRAKKSTSFLRYEKVPRNGEAVHLVFYAKDLHSITTRITCSNTGGWVFVEPTETVGGIKVGGR